MTRKKEWSLTDTKHVTAEDHLCGEEKPTENQVSWVLVNLLKTIEENKTYRNFIYDCMGFGPEAYSRLLDGAKIITIFQNLGKNEKKN